MKSFVLFYLSIICTFSIHNVFSYNRHDVRLLNLLRKSFNTKELGVTTRNDEDASTLIPKQETNSIENEDKMQARADWDSGEDYYFLWANKNRRPIEYLAGRKRDANKAVIPPRASRINGGLWRSGLVG